MKVTYPEHCGNSPKKLLLIELHKAIAEDDKSFILDNLTDDVVLNLVGQREVTGKDSVTALFDELGAKDIQEIIVDNAITHGNTAAVHGAFQLTDGSRIDFCHVVVFRGFSKTAKIKEIKSYLI